MSSPIRSARTITVRALLAATLLVAMFAASAGTAFASDPTVSIRVEGQNATLFNGTAPVGTSVITDTGTATHTMSGNAMCALDVAADRGAFPYEVVNSAFGLYVSSVDNELPVPSPPYPGWMVRVNGVMPSVGADQVALHSGDSVLWYYGTYDASPTVAALPASTVTVGSSAVVIAKQLDAAGAATPLAGATVYVGSRTATSAADGRASSPRLESATSPCG